MKVSELLLWMLGLFFLSLFAIVPTIAEYVKTFGPEWVRTINNQGKVVFVDGVLMSIITTEISLLLGVIFSVINALIKGEDRRKNDTT